MRKKNNSPVEGKNFCCSVGSLENRFKDGALPAGGSLGNDLGIDTCVEIKTAD